MNDEKDTQIVIESDPFSMLPNDFIRNPDISNDAKALYAIIKSYIGIPDFILYKSTLVKSFKGGDFRFRNAWKELKDTGYFSQIKVKTVLYIVLGCIAGFVVLLIICCFCCYKCSKRKQKKIIQNEYQSNLSGPLVYY